MAFHLGSKKYINYRPYSNLNSDDETPSKTPNEPKVFLFLIVILR